jgi:hypothetical protein
MGDLAVDRDSLGSDWSSLPYVMPAVGMAKPTIVHVHQQRIRANIKRTPEEREPPVIVRQGSRRFYGNNVTIHGPSRIVYAPDKPLDCGARLYIEVAPDVAIEITD